MKKPKLILFAQFILILAFLLLFSISVISYFAPKIYNNSSTPIIVPTPTGSLPPDFDKVLAPTPTLTLPPLAAVDRYLPYPLELEEKIRKSLRKGQVAFNVPERMSVGDTEEIEVKVTQNLDKKLNIQVKKGQKIERKTIDIYHNMKAELTGAGFNIKPLQEDDTFLVLEENVAAWSWAITPNKTGKQKLHLKINAKLKLDDSEITYNLQSLKRTIEVQVNPGNWLQKNWLKIVEIFLVIFGSGIVAYIASKLTVMKKLTEKINSWIKSTFSRLKKK